MNLEERSSILEARSEADTFMDYDRAQAFQTPAILRMLVGHDAQMAEQ